MTHIKITLWILYGGVATSSADYCTFIIFNQHYIELETNSLKHPTYSYITLWKNNGSFSVQFIISNHYVYVCVCDCTLRVLTWEVITTLVTKYSLLVLYTVVFKGFLYVQPLKRASNSYKQNNYIDTLCMLRNIYFMDFTVSLLFVLFSSSNFDYTYHREDTNEL